jgi:hypothetical protein
MVAGFLNAGTIDHPGFPCAQRPTALSGQWQFNMQGGDVGSIQVLFGRWNPDLGEEEPVGLGQYLMSGVMPQWQPFTIPITYTSDLDPDTAYITIFSSSGVPVDGTTLWVDDLHFDLPLGVAEVPSVPEVRLRLSLSSNELVIIGDGLLQEVLLLDLSGRELTRGTPHANTAIVGIAALPAGPYVARARFGDGHVAARVFVKD